MSLEIITPPLVALIFSQDTDTCKVVDHGTTGTTSTFKREIRKRNRLRQDKQAHIVYGQLASELDQAKCGPFKRKKLLPIPLEEHGF